MFWNYLRAGSCNLLAEHQATYVYLLHSLRALETGYQKPLKRRQLHSKEANNYITVQSPAVSILLKN